MIHYLRNIYLKLLGRYISFFVTLRGPVCLHSCAALAMDLIKQGAGDVKVGHMTQQRRCVMDSGRPGFESWFDHDVSSPATFAGSLLIHGEGCVRQNNVYLVGASVVPSGSESNLRIRALRP